MYSRQSSKGSVSGVVNEGKERQRSIDEAGGEPANGCEDMSVFTDFQSAWVSRFPGSGLPKAWEDDVRGNLVKHKQKVALLKEELEKEEFYVEYLGRLLADVERVRIEKQQLESQSSQQTQLSSQQEQSPTVTSTSSCQQQQRQPDNGASESPDRVTATTSPSGPNNKANGDQVNHSNQSALVANGDQYVTVIAVSSSAPGGGDGNRKGSKVTPPVALRDDQSEKPLIESCLHQDVNLNNANNLMMNKAAERESVADTVKERDERANLRNSNGDMTKGSVRGNVCSKVQQLQQTQAAAIVGFETKSQRASLSQQQPIILRDKKRPPTPPRKPKINPSNFPGLQFIGRESFGKAVILSPTPPPPAPEVASVKPEPKADPVVPLITGTPELVQLGKSHEAAVASPVTKATLPTDGPQVAPCAESPPPARPASPGQVDLEPAYAVRLLSDIQHGSGSLHSLTSADSDANRFEVDTNGSRGYKSEEEINANEYLCMAGVADEPDDEDEHAVVLADEDDEEEEAIYDTVAPDLDGSSLDSHLNGCSADEEADINNLNKDGHFHKRHSSATNLSTANFSDINSYSNYVNIDYFLRREETSSKNDSDDNETQMSHSIGSDHEIDSRDISSSREEMVKAKKKDQTYDEVFHDPDLYGAYYGVVDSDPNSPNNTSKDRAKAPSDEQRKADAERLMMTRCIVASISESETAYVDCLNTLLQYMKAIKSTIGTTHPLVSTEDLNIMFYKIPDLHSIHCSFLDGLKKLAVSDNNQLNDTNRSRSGNGAEQVATLGDLFKNLASRLGAYSAYLKNYSRALETVQKCSSGNNQFAEITRAIKLKSVKGQATASLEELLHKPVARVQKNALVLHDLLKYTPEHHHEHKSLKTALKMTQCFLNDLNIAATEEMFPPVQDKTQRRLVKESFIIELVENKRKLRHLFLFNDVIVCAKYRPSTRQRFTFDVKWYSLLSDITIPESEESTTVTAKEKEMNTEIMSLKSRVSSLRDTMAKEEKAKANNKVCEKLRKKQAELEGQLVLLLPQLALHLAQRNGKNYTFYLSSEYERTQWIESVRVLQQTAATTSSSSSPSSSSVAGHQPGETINFNELQAWIETCRKGLNPNLGSFLLRSSKDEELLNGDLYLEILTLKGLSRPADLYFVIEADMYGHYSQKCQTRVAREALEPVYNQEFVLDLDGSQTLRILCYEEVTGNGKAHFLGKASIELSRSWITDKYTEKDVNMLDSVLSIKVRFVSSEASTIRFPAGKVYGAFGSNIQTVCKKEKSAIPYLIIGCVREVERRGVKELGIYRVSGLSSDVQRLKKAFETNPYEAEHLLKEIDIHSVTGLLKMYLRELPEALFTNALYKKFFDAFSVTAQDDKKRKLVALFSQLPQVNQNTITFLIEHLVNVNQYESCNKMSLHNLATVFGPTMIRPGSNSNQNVTTADQFTAGTIDVMAQAGILHFFLKRKVTPSPETAC
ncbi:Breakpoint cluster region protein [Halotydeus destructor]|nr:Breakpoint cluster region protein [Halotydeus destructor]